MARRSIQRKGSSDKAVPTAAMRKQAVASDDQGHSGLSQLEHHLLESLRPFSVMVTVLFQMH
jgi:hypothetical protein